MSDTIFDKIVRHEVPSYNVWEDDDFMAFLTIFPNTPGLTVVIPKTNPGDNVFKMDDKTYAAFLLAVKKVANLLEVALDVKRVAVVFEGTGVAYAHAKLYPLYGDLAGQTGVESKETEFVTEYRGYLTTLEGPQMDGAELAAIQAKIRAVA